MKLHQKLEVIIDKAKKLSEQHHKLIFKNSELENELKTFKKQLIEETNKNNELLNKIKIIKLAQNIGEKNIENTETEELKKKINEYIKEIDHCITMLND